MYVVQHVLFINYDFANNSSKISVLVYSFDTLDLICRRTATSHRSIRNDLIGVYESGILIFLVPNFVLVLVWTIKEAFSCTFNLVILINLAVLLQILALEFRNQVYPWVVNPPMIFVGLINCKLI